jgi:hypothetical protein
VTAVAGVLDLDGRFDVRGQLALALQIAKGLADQFLDVGAHFLPNCGNSGYCNGSRGDVTGRLIHKNCG